MADDHQHPEVPQDQGVQVDAQALVNRLREQRTALQNELDIIILAYEDSKQQNALLLERIAELEDKDQKPTKAK